MILKLKTDAVKHLTKLNYAKFNWLTFIGCKYRQMKVTIKYRTYIILVYRLQFWAAKPDLVHLMDSRIIHNTFIIIVYMVFKPDCMH